MSDKREAVARAIWGQLTEGLADWGACRTDHETYMRAADAAIAALEPERESVVEVREVSEEEAKHRLLAGDRIVFSMDGDEAWFDGGDQARCTDVVVGLRQKGYLTRKVDPECDRGFCWDEASDRLRALAERE